MNASDAVAQRLMKLGVDSTFGVSGANIEDMFAALRRAGLRIVLAKHEAAAGMMADGYARVKGVPALVIATSGAGAMNLVPALAEARASSVPMLAIVGEPPTDLQGRGAFQDTSGKDGKVDALRVLAPVSVFSARARRAEELPTLIDEAFAAATGPEPGPAVVLVAKDLQRSEIGSAPSVRQGPPAPQPDLDDRDLERAEALLVRGDAIIVAGDGVARAGARARLQRLVEALDAFVAVTPEGRDAFDNRSDRFLGVAGGMGHAVVDAALRAARVIVVVGTRLPLLARQGHETALSDRPMIVVGGELPFVAPPDAVHLRGEVGSVLEVLCSRLRDVHPTAGSFGGCGDVILISRGRRLEGMSCRAVLDSVDAALPEDAIVLVDAGNTGAHAIHRVRAPRRGRELIATGMAGMGYTFGAAIGAAVASGKPVFVIAGDGSFFMHGMEIHTAVQHVLPITYVLLNNNAHGMCLTRERTLLREEGGHNVFERSRIGAGLAAMFPGLTAVDCASQSEFDAALGCAAGRRGPAVLCAEVDAAEIPPFAALHAASPGSVRTLPTSGENHEGHSRLRAV